MRLTAWDPDRAREIDRFDSTGSALARLAGVRERGQVSGVQLAPGGRIGRHVEAAELDT